MSIQLQNYLVYLIVGATSVSILLPLLKSLAGLLPENRRLNKGRQYSTYSNACSKCTISKQAKI